MVLRSGYLALALKLQEAAEKSPDRFREKLTAALAAETEDGPWKAFLEAGARHSASDMGHLQAIHDASMVLGATCGGMADSTKESAGAGAQSNELQLIESASTEVIEIREAKADYEIKLIAPGRGAMAYYPADVLKRDGPGAFPAETKVYVNHPTKSQESEGQGNRNVYRLAGVLTTPAEYKESHPKGAGLFARVKVFADHAQMFEEKGKYLGMSIMANGQQAVESGKPSVREGLPVLGRLTCGQSVDVVPIAGAGGMILQESAASAAITNEGDGMTEAEAKVLIEAAVSAATAPLRQRALRGDAREEAARLLESVTLPLAAKTRIIERSIATLPTAADGSLDSGKLRELIVAEAKSEGEYIASLTGTGVRGMGIAAVAPPTPKPEEIAAREASDARQLAEDVKIYESLGMTKRGAELAAKGREAA